MIEVSSKNTKLKKKKKTPTRKTRTHRRVCNHLQEIYNSRARRIPSSRTLANVHSLHVEQWY